MGFEPVTSALPVRCSTNWAMKLLLSNCLNWKIYCDDHSSLSSTTAVQNELFHIYFTSKCTITQNNFKTLQSCSLGEQLPGADPWILLIGVLWSLIQKTWLESHLRQNTSCLILCYPKTPPTCSLHFNQFDISLLSPLPCGWVLLIEDAPLEHPSLLLCLVTKALLKLSMLMLRSSLQASSPGCSGGGEEKGRRACDYVSGIFISASKKLMRKADWQRWH